MVKRIAWLDTAKRQFFTIAAYMAENYSATTAERFSDEIFKKLTRLMKYPESGHLSRVQGVRYVIIRKRYNLYYRQLNDILYIVFLWDSKRDPRKNPYRK